MLRDGQSNIDDPLESEVEIWTMGSLHLPSQPRVPTSFQRTQTTGEAGEIVSMFKHNYQYYFIGRPDEDFFRIPEGC